MGEDPSSQLAQAWAGHQCSSKCLQYHPRGLQLYLGTAQQPHQLDTLVMSNLGYFQLKAGPGVWDLQLAPGLQKCFF